MIVAHHAGQLLELGFAGVSAALALRCIWSRNWLAAAGWSTLLLLATIGWVLPWYVLWLLPLAALARTRLLVPATLALTLTITSMWLVYTVTLHHHRHRHALATVGAAATAPPGSAQRFLQAPTTPAASRGSPS